MATPAEEGAINMPPSFFLLTPFRFRLPRTKPLNFGKALEEISDYGMTESYYRTLDYATKLRRNLVKIIDHYATTAVVPPPKDNLQELDEIVKAAQESSLGEDVSTIVKEEILDKIEL